MRGGINESLLPVMTDHATPSLPTRDFAVTAAFHAGLGFVGR